MAESLDELCLAERLIRNAIQEIKDLFFSILHTQDSDKSQTIHRIFQVHPASSKDQFWESHLVEPVLRNVE